MATSQQSTSQMKLLWKHLQEQVEKDLWHRSLQSCRLKHDKSFHVETYDGLRDMANEIAERKRDYDIHRKFFSQTMSFLSRNFPSPTSVTQPNATSISSQPSTSARKVVNITNNYYYDGKKSVKSSGLIVDLPTADDDASTKSGKSRRAKRRIFLGETPKQLGPVLDVVIFPSVCNERNCVKCSSWLISSVSECKMATCPRSAEHIATRHLPNLNCADRRFLRRCHRQGASSDDILSTASGHTSTGTLRVNEKVEKYVTSLPSRETKEVVLGKKKRRMSDMEEGSSTSWADQVDDSSNCGSITGLSPAMEAISELSLDAQDSNPAF